MQSRTRDWRIRLVKRSTECLPSLKRTISRSTSVWSIEIPFLRFSSRSMELVSPKLHRKPCSHSSRLMPITGTFTKLRSCSTCLTRWMPGTHWLPVPKLRTRERDRCCHLSSWRATMRTIEREKLDWGRELFVHSDRDRDGIHNYIGTACKASIICRNSPFISK